MSYFYTGNFCKVSIVIEAPKERISIHVGKNEPDSRAEFDAFHPEKYPIKMHLLFSKHYGHIVEELKASLDAIPKEKARYKKNVNKYTNGVSFYGYFKDADSMRPFAESLKGKGLYVEPIQGEAKQVFPQQLIEMAGKALLAGRKR